MKIVVLTTARTGSHAFCEIQPVERNFEECLNIEDLILPRDRYGRVLEEHFTPEFNDELKSPHRKESYNYLYQTTPKLENVYYRSYDNEMNQIVLDELPYFKDVEEAHRIRWNNIKKYDSWVLKIMHYHDVRDDLLEDILQEVDKIYVLCRRNKIKQVFSAMNVIKTGVFHTDDPKNEYTGVDEFPIHNALYDLEAIIECEQDWLRRVENHKYKTEQVFYEDLDLSGAKKSVKLNVKTTYTHSQFASYLLKHSMPAFYRDTEYTEIGKKLIESFQSINWKISNEDQKYNSEMIATYNRQTSNLNHIMPPINYLESILTSKHNKESKILDIGGYFGILEATLIQAGFKNVESTESLQDNPTLNYIRSHLGLSSPKYLEITPYVELSLEEQYDLITCFANPAFWHRDVVHINYHTNCIDESNTIIDQNGDFNIWIVPWKRAEWAFFINDIKQYLNPGGTAVISMPPLRRDMKINSMYDTLNYLKKYQTSLYFKDYTDFPSDMYIIIEKEREW